eukprot:118695-Hanusia_phi.AAC.3
MQEGQEGGGGGGYRRPFRGGSRGAVKGDVGSNGSESRAGCMAQPQNVSAKTVEVKIVPPIAHIQYLTSCGQNNLTQRHPNDFMSIMQQSPFQLLNGMPSMLNGMQLPAAKVGNKTIEQCQSYARFYFEALKHHKKLPAAPGKPTNLHIKASDVYNFLGIGMAYKEFLSTMNSSSPLKTLTASFVPSTPSLSSFTDGFSISKPKVEQETQSSSSKGSIDFLCSSSDVPCEPLSISNVYQGSSSISAITDPGSRNGRPAANKNLLSPKNEVWTWPTSTAPQQTNRVTKPYNGNHLPTLAASHMQPLAAQYGTKKEEWGSSLNNDAKVQQEYNEAMSDKQMREEEGKPSLENGNATWPSSEDDASKSMAMKRRRPESPTKDKVAFLAFSPSSSIYRPEREIDKNRINKRDMWTYACMQQAPATKEEKEAQEKEENLLDVKNPWDWTRKLIIKSSGYSNWFVSCLGQGECDMSLGLAGGRISSSMSSSQSEKWAMTSAPYATKHLLLLNQSLKGPSLPLTSPPLPSSLLPFSPIPCTCYPHEDSIRRGDDRETKRPRKDAPVHGDKDGVWLGRADGCSGRVGVQRMHGGGEVGRRLVARESEEGDGKNFSASCDSVWTDEATQGRRGA